MKKIFLLLFSSLLLLTNVEKGEAKMEKDVFEIEIKLYTAQEIKEIFPNMELGNGHGEIKTSSDNYWYPTSANYYNYLFGWVKLKKGEWSRITGQKMIPGCKIIVWNKFFKYAFNVVGVTEQKAYFLVPLGVALIPDRNFEYRISTVP